ncbi:MAG TPA: MobA/MobL family protein [Longimicrobiaceae bacterium]
MDFVHVSIATVQRSRGQSSVARAAYQSGRQLRDERTGDTYDYRYRRSRGEIQASVLVRPDGATWTNPRARRIERLWNEVEKAERRRDAQVARSGIVALPHSLSPEGRVEAMVEFARQVARRYRTPVQADLHAPGRHEEADPRNTHFHWQMPTRSLDADGHLQGGAKIQELSRRSLARAEVRTLRGLWVDVVNRILLADGIRRADGTFLQLDARSYREQGVEQIPTVHLGVVATALERKGVPTERGDENRRIRSVNGQLAKLDAEIAALQRVREPPPAAEARAPESPQTGMPERQMSAVPEPGIHTPSGTPRPAVAGEARAGLTGLDSLLSDLHDLERVREIEQEIQRVKTEILHALQEQHAARDAAARVAAEELDTWMCKVYRSPKEATRAWWAYHARQGDGAAVQTLADVPEIFGGLREERVARFGIPRADDRQARAAARQAADAAQRLLTARTTVPQASEQAQESARALRRQLNQFRVERRQLGTRDQLRLRIARQWAAQPRAVAVALERAHPYLARVAAEAMKHVAGVQMPGVGRSQ